VLGFMISRGPDTIVDRRRRGRLAPCTRLTPGANQGRSYLFKAIRNGPPVHTVRSMKPGPSALGESLGDALSLPDMKFEFLRSTAVSTSEACLEAAFCGRSKIRKRAALTSYVELAPG
jgi:hypothetical protein